MITVLPFQIVKCTGCEGHENLTKEQRSILSCGCPLADRGCYALTYNGYGTGIIYEDLHEGMRKITLMNLAIQIQNEFQRPGWRS